MTNPRVWIWKLLISFYSEYLYSFQEEMLDNCVLFLQIPNDITDYSKIVPISSSLSKSMIGDYNKSLYEMVSNFLQFPKQLKCNFLLPSFKVDLVSSTKG